MRVQVVCLRKVDWSKFNLNFFMVFAPGVLENAPQFHLFSTRVPSARIAGQLQRALLQRTPNVSSVDLTSILATVRRILEKAAQVIQWLAGFSILAALPILAGALLNGKEQRVKESLLLRTLGASEIQVRTIVLVEYASLGSLSAVSGILLALVAQWAEARWIFKTPLQHELVPILLALSAACGGSIAAGLWLTRGVCNRPPLEALRQES
jgi:putative ABC transport system permease protein